MLSENAVTAEYLLITPGLGETLWRNNVGALLDQRGRPVRYGLANESKQMNEVLKSGDRIGWRSVTITPDMVGQTFAQFVSREMKAQGWQYTGQGREPAQMRWGVAVNEAGGDASFVTMGADGRLISYPCTGY